MVRHVSGSFWNEDRDQFIRDYAPGHSHKEIMEEFERVFGEKVRNSQIKSRKTFLEVKSGTNGGRFETGRKNMHKGMRWDDFMSPEGQENSRAALRRYAKENGAHNALPVGSERVRDGYVYVKVRDRCDKSHHSTFESRSRLTWIKHHGEIPEGYCIIHVNGDRGDDSIENLRCVPIAIRARLRASGLNRLRSAETIDALIGVATVQQKAFEIEKSKMERNYIDQD